MDLLNLSRPWDCESFPKSKTICYGGGGGSTGDIPIVKKVAKETGYTGSDIDKTGQKVEKTVKNTGDAVKVPKVKIDARWTGLPKFPQPIKVPEIRVAVPTVDDIKDTLARSDVGKTATKIHEEIGKGTEHLKKEGQKLKEGDFSLKKAVQGTASGAEDTFKKSDVGKTVKTIADKSGYTGSDLDKSFQKIEREGANVINQGLDVLDQPGKYLSDKWEEFKQYAGDRFGWHPKKDDDRPRSSSDKSTTGPGRAKTMGQGNIEGLKGGGSLASSNRARIRQNKRKLRIARA